MQATDAFRYQVIESPLLHVRQVSETRIFRGFAVPLPWSAPHFGFFLWHLDADAIRAVTNESGTLPQAYTPGQV